MYFQRCWRLQWWHHHLWWIWWGLLWGRNFLVQPQLCYLLANICWQVQLFLTQWMGLKKIYVGPSQPLLFYTHGSFLQLYTHCCCQYMLLDCTSWSWTEFRSFHWLVKIYNKCITKYFSGIFLTSKIKWPKNMGQNWATKIEWQTLKVIN